MRNVKILLKFEIVLICAVFFIGCQNRMAEKEIKEVNQQYSILKISDSINGIITNIYKPSNFRYDGKTLFFTLNNSLDMHLFTKLDLSNTYDLFLDVCINDSLFKHPNSDTLWVFKKNTNERLFWVVDEK